MRILAIDTSCGAASVAVVQSGDPEPLAFESRILARGHAEVLAPMVEQAIHGVDGGFRSIDRIAVTIGPGSFTGIRVGIAITGGMALALGVNLAGISTLAALAAPVLGQSKPGIIAAAIDARHGSV